MSSGLQNVGRTKIYIGNLANSVTEKDLESLVMKYGRLNKVWVAKSPPGYGFVDFDDARDSMEAIVQLKGKMFHGNRLQPELARGAKNEREFRRERDFQEDEYRLERVNAVEDFDKPRALGLKSPSKSSSSNSVSRRNHPRYNRRFQIRMHK
eukprot:Platyproteum_vivax@DN4820_c0_g1_i1.p1